MDPSVDPAMARAIESARRALAKALGQKEVEVTFTEAAAVPTTGERLLRVTAIAPGKHNEPQQVVVDAAGKVRDLAELEASVGRRLFVPEIGLDLGRF